MGECSTEYASASSTSGPGFSVKRERKFFLVYIGKFFTTGITQVVQW
jgi:hypothetical protein